MKISHTKAEITNQGCPIANAFLNIACNISVMQWALLLIPQRTYTRYPVEIFNMERLTTTKTKRHMQTNNLIRTNDLDKAY